MSNEIRRICAIFALSVFLAGCAWKPSVPAVPITAPWSGMNLPVKDNAVVWKSEPNEFRAVHKADKKTVTKSYTEALRAQGWQLNKFDESGDRWVLEMKKDDDEINVEIYDFENTGVLIEKK